MDENNKNPFNIDPKCDDNHLSHSTIIFPILGAQVGAQIEGLVGDRGCSSIRLLEMGESLVNRIICRAERNLTGPLPQVNRIKWEARDLAAGG